MLRDSRPFRRPLSAIHPMHPGRSGRKTDSPPQVPQAEPRASPRRLMTRILAWTALVAGVVGLLVVGFLPRFQARAELATQDETAHGARRVRVTRPALTTPSELTLPASFQADQATDLFARVSGYLKVWRADLGARVKAGDLLAEIDTPELDREVEEAVALTKAARADLSQSLAELEEAKADLELANANARKADAQQQFARSMADRNDQLARDRVISREDQEASRRDLDSRSAEVSAAAAEISRRKTALATRATVIKSREATVSVREAGVNRLRELQGFKKIVAPFDGVVTARRAEVGMLVTSGSPGAVPLFGLARTDVLRLRVPVPQSYAAPLRVGDEARVSVPEHPGRLFSARVNRSAGAVDLASRTLLVELDLDNAEGLLMPGTFAEVHLTARRGDAALRVPANTLLMRSSGPQVAVVSGGGTVRLQPVRLGRDHGTHVDVLTGLNGQETLVVNPTDDLEDGTKVTVIE
jgi:RND family efflux transporter MFP subunit